MSLTTCSKRHCWGASLDNGWCNKHVDERITELEAKNAKLKALLNNAVAREKEANRGWSTAARERDAFRVAAKAVVDKRYDMGGAAEYNALAALVEVKT